MRFPEDVKARPRELNVLTRIITEIAITKFNCILIHVWEPVFDETVIYSRALMFLLRLSWPTLYYSPKLTLYGLRGSVLAL